MKILYTCHGRNVSTIDESFFFNEERYLPQGTHDLVALTTFLQPASCLLQAKLRERELAFPAMLGLGHMTSWMLWKSCEAD